jgi:hypothetical protein
MARDAPAICLRARSKRAKATRFSPFSSRETLGARIGPSGMPWVSSASVVPVAFGKSAAWATAGAGSGVGTPGSSPPQPVTRTHADRRQASMRRGEPGIAAPS